MELRGENVPVAEPSVARWLCRSCGLRWDPAAYADLRLWDRSERFGPNERPSRPGPASESELPDGPGIVLRRARHEAGKTLADVSRATGVWERFLMALEDDAPLEEFPAHSYARMYLREYAQYLGLEPEPLLAALDALHPEVVEEPVLEPLPDHRGRRRVLAIVLTILSVAALALIVLNRPQSPAGVQSDLPPGRAPDTTGAVQDEPTAPRAPAREQRGVRVELEVDQRSWVEAISDGEVVQAASFDPGKVLILRARRSLQLTLGNAGGVRLRVDGERVRTGAPGEVLSLAFRWKDGTLSVARA
ncbi:MAG TPA: RodZ domain-containing protein [Actinomycetota bacterium]|nr:RodZ domain-containing protein [Actinomycetota bacterium]